MTTARGDNKSRAAISIGDVATPWASESGADGTESDSTMHDATHKRGQMKPGKRVSLAVRLSVAVLSPVFFLVLIELVLRLFGYGLSSDFFIPWTYNGKTVYLSNPRFCQHFVPKELSRSPEPSVLYPKDPCTLRIFVFGESAANGDPEPAYGFCGQLEILLNEHSDRRSFEVINAAVTAMNSFVARRIAEDCAAHQPDLFILYMGNNEVIGPYGPPTLPPAFYKSRGFINTRITIEKETRLGQLLKNGVRDLRSAGRAPRQWAGMEAFLEQDNQGRPLGDSVLVDHVHLNARGNFRIAWAAMQAIRQALPQAPGPFESVRSP